MRVPRGKCRNGGRPIQGIDTHQRRWSGIDPVLVEMKVAPFSALTQIKNTDFYSIIANVEMKVAPFRVLPHFVLGSDVLSEKSCRNEARLTHGIQTNHKKTSELSPQIRKLAGPFLLYSRIR